MTKSLLVPLTILLLSCAVAGVAYAQSPEPAGGASSAETAVSNEVLAVAKLITYQGRLLNPTTHVPKTDDTYPIVLKLYNNATSTAAVNVVWSETQNVATQDGYFSVLLGNVSTFSPALFNGQDLWLGVAVGGDAEATPRTRMTAVAYALYAENAGTATSAQTANNANLLDGIDSTAFTTDSEVMPLVKAADGSGSGIDADFLDGLNGASYAKLNQALDFQSTVACGGFTGYQNQNVDPAIWVNYRLAPTTAGANLRLSVDVTTGVGGTITYAVWIENLSVCSSDPAGFRIYKQVITN